MMLIVVRRPVVRKAASPLLLHGIQQSHAGLGIAYGFQPPLRFLAFKNLF